MQCPNTEKNMKDVKWRLARRSSSKPLPLFLAVWVLKFCSLNVRGCMVIKNASFNMTVFWPDLVLRVLFETWLKKSWPTHLASEFFSLIIYLQHLMYSFVNSQFDKMSSINCFYGKRSVQLWKSFRLVYECDVINCHLHSFLIEDESLCVTFLHEWICLLIFVRLAGNDCLREHSKSKSWKK